MRLSQTLESALGRLTQIRAGSYRLKPDDVVTVTTALRAWFTFLLSSMPYSGEDEVVRERRITQFGLFIIEQCRKDINDVFKSLRTLIEILLRDAKKGKKTSLRSFKGSAIARGLKPYVEGLLSAESLIGMTSWMADWKYLYTGCRFLTKLPISATWLEEEMLEKFLSNLERVRDFDRANAAPDIVDLNSILKRWLSDFHITTLRPRHGPGAVAEGKQQRGWMGKWGCMASDSRVAALTRYLALRDPEWPSTMEALCLRDIVGKPARENRIAKLVFVAKTSLSLRTIMSEPALLQYLQQGVLGELVRYIEGSPTLHRVIDFKRQECNQVLAKIGSCEIGVSTSNPVGNYNANFATIDLSMASDSIAWALTQQLFAGTELLLWMSATRSTKIRLPNKQVIKSPLFAPMGSALCFPTQSLIFAAIVELCRERFRRRYGSSGLDLCPTYRVYGDDIVVPAVLANDVMTLLMKLGFIPNEAKSFTSGPFRESCGKEYYHGVDVTPLYYRVKAKVGNVISAETFGALCSAANNAADWGSPALRKHYLRTLMASEVDIGSIRIRAIPFFTNKRDRDPAVWSPNPTNWLLPTRWHKGYQCRQYRQLVVKVRQPVKRTGPLWDSISYRRWLISHTQNQVSGADVDPVARIELDRNTLRAALSRLPLQRSAGWADLNCFRDFSPPKDPYGIVEMVYALKWTHLLG